MSWKHLKIYKAPKVLAKASSQEKDLQKQQAQMYATLNDAFKTQFAKQGNILMSLQNAWGPVINAGINQYGFSPQEDTSLRTSSSDAIARNFANSQTALNENLASRGGGNTFLPSGATAQLEAGLMSDAATQQAATSNAITQKGYDIGRSNFQAATGALTNAAGLYSPTGYAGVANNAGSDAFNSANIINQQNTAWQGALTGALTGAGEAFLGGPAAAKVFSSGGGAAPVMTPFENAGGTLPMDPNFSPSLSF